MADFGLMVEFDGANSFSVNIPMHYFNKTQGICGDFDGNAGNDLLQGDNPDESYCLTGQQWEVENPDDPG